MINNCGMKFSKAVEDELSRRKSLSERRLAEHKEDIRKNHPDINAVRQEIAELTLDFSDKLIASPDDAEALSALASGMIEAKERELEMKLKEAGLPVDYLKAVPECSSCGDTGVCDGQLCSCVKNIMILDRFHYSGLNPGQTFELLRHDLIDDPRERRAYDNICAYCLKYADSFPNNELGDLLLLGVPGVGKTYLLNSIGERVLKNGYSVLRLTANQLISIALNCTNKHESLPDMTVPDLLILDDIGTEPMIGNITIETLLSIICERQDRGLSTLIATNKSLESLTEEYGDRITSRLFTPQRVKVIKMTTPSIRFIKT